MTSIRDFAAAASALLIVSVLMPDDVPVRAQTPALRTFKVAYFNIQSGKGEPALPAVPSPFPDTSNCTDPSLPLNAWGLGIVQRELTARIGNDASVVALSLGEAWACAKPSAVRSVLGWRAVSSERNGVSIVARHGFGGPEQWLQLDTTRNLNPRDTKWVLRVPVCLDSQCSRSVTVFTAHWYGLGLPPVEEDSVFEFQAQQTLDFMSAIPAGQPHILVGDLNVFEGTENLCGQHPKKKPLQMLRDAGYLDAWPAIHGPADGSTGMWARPGCGTPEGNLFKRIDYTWSKGLNPVSTTRFGMVKPGEAAPSDHAGIITEFPTPDVKAASVPPTALIRTPVQTAIVSGNVTVSVNAQDDQAVVRVELLIDGSPFAVSRTAPFNFTWNSAAMANGAHSLQAAVSDEAGNRTLSAVTSVTVANPVAPGDEIVLHASDAIIAGDWRKVYDSTAASGKRLQNPDAGAVRLSYVPTMPSSYVDVWFEALAGKPYRLWIRGKAQADSTLNDAIYVQFKGSVTASGAPVNRIGTTAGLTIDLEECDGCGLSGWGWQDTATSKDVLGPVVYFATSGWQQMRIQAREDGIGIDQVVVSSRQFLTQAPGAATDDATILPRTGQSATGSSTNGEIVMYAARAVVARGWTVTPDASAAGGSRLQNPDAGAAKVTQALAAPVNYFELTFNADAGKAYRLWIRAIAQRNDYANDSVYVQFDRSTDTTGNPVNRIGTSSAATVVLENCTGCGVQGWGWQDNGYGTGVLGPVVYFATGGPQRIRVQVREDGIGIDQLVLSAVKYMTKAPGSTKNDATVLPVSGW
jgi:hypothetical protein